MPASTLEDPRGQKLMTKDVSVHVWHETWCTLQKSEVLGRLGSLQTAVAETARSRNRDLHVRWRASECVGDARRSAKLGQGDPGGDHLFHFPRLGNQGTSRSVSAPIAAHRQSYGIVRCCIRSRHLDLLWLQLALPIRKNHLTWREELSKGDEQHAPHVCSRMHFDIQDRNPYSRACLEHHAGWWKSCCPSVWCRRQDSEREALEALGSQQNSILTTRVVYGRNRMVISERSECTTSTHRQAEGSEVWDAEIRSSQWESAYDPWEFQAANGASKVHPSLGCWRSDLFATEDFQGEGDRMSTLGVGRPSGPRDLGTSACAPTLRKSEEPDGEEVSMWWGRGNVPREGPRHVGDGGASWC